MLTNLYIKAANLFAEVKNDERGVTAIEYGLIAVAMAVVLGAVFSSDGSMVTALTDVFSTIVDELTIVSSDPK